MRDIKLIEEDHSGLQAELYDTKDLDAAWKWIAKWGVGLTILFVIVWPALSLPEGVFSKSYFAFWVFVSLAWGFCAAMVIIILPIYESWDAIMRVWAGFANDYLGFPALQEGAKATEMVGGGPKLVSEIKLPDRISEQFWKENCHSHKFEKEAFDKLAVDGTISRDEFQAIVGSKV